MPRKVRPTARASQTWKESPRFQEVAADLGAEIRRLRKRAGLTLEAAGERMEMDWRHLHKIESGTLNVTLVSLMRIADGLRRPMAALFRKCLPPPDGKRSRPART